MCSLADQPGAQNANIGGQDGTDSIKVDDTVYWMFGDTVWTGARMKSLPNNVAWTTDTDASDCVTLTHKSITTGGVARAQALLPVRTSEPIQRWAWPMSMFQVEPGFIHFFSLEPEFASGSLQIEGVSTAKFPADPAHMDAVQTSGGQFVWDNVANGGLNLWPADAIVEGEYVYVYLNSTPGDWYSTTTNLLLARVSGKCPASGCLAEDPAAYEYWDGATGGWTKSLGDADPVWTESPRFAGVTVSFNEFLDKWVATYGSWRGPELRVRTADNLWGPWSEGSTLLDCDPAYPPVGSGLLCYTAVQHPEFSKDGGRTIYVSNSVNYFDTSGAYLYHEDVREFQLAAPIWQWHGASGESMYAPDGAATPAGTTRDGIAFYAADKAGTFLGPVHRWRESTTGGLRYGHEVPLDGSYQDMGVAFYAPANALAAIATNEPYGLVYRWTNGASTRYSPLDLAGDGYTRREGAFYALCPDSDGDGLSDCEESFVGTSASSRDTDSDGMTDDFEHGTTGCDPTVPYTDRDGIASADEIAAGTNPCRNLIGRVITDDPAMPVGGATVQLYSVDPATDSLVPAKTAAFEPPVGTQRTGDDGSYAWDVDPGRYVVIGSSPGCTMLGTLVAIIPPDANDVYVRLSCPDSDGDGLRDYRELEIGTDPYRTDSDGDGCTDFQELNLWIPIGAQSDPLNPWDFFDTPNPLDGGSRDGVVDVDDVLRIAQRFASSGSPTMDPWSSPPLTGYHDGYDREFLGPAAWDLGAPDGAITIDEIFWDAAQFARACSFAMGS